MRYGANLNVIIKSLEKATSHISRDFIELENLQSNPSSADRFAVSCYNRVKQILLDDLSKMRPEYNIIFADGQKFSRNPNAEYSYIIHVIDGFENLKRSNPDFTVAIALEYCAIDGKKESIAVAISKVFGGETYYSEKGFGAYLNNRRIRTSKRTAGEILAATSSQSLLAPKDSLRSYGCKTLEIAYLASSRLEKVIYSKKDFALFKNFTLLVREAGGSISEDEKTITISA